MSRRLKLEGHRCGRLLVVKCIGVDKHQRTIWRCVCDCGKTTNVMVGNLRSGETKSCGCLFLHSVMVNGKKRKTHGHASNGKVSRTYVTWRSMLARCENPQTNDYKYYGGKGIKVCARWHLFEHFLADMGARPKGRTLDRRNSNKDYCKHNCRWATWKQQAKNRNKS